MARSLAAALDVAFMLDSEVDNLSQSVQQKYACDSLFFLIFPLIQLGASQSEIQFCKSCYECH
jgi:hypothetical protein